MRYDAEHKERTRERVLREAVLAIRADGPERLSIADVMRRAGLTHGGFYAHFPSREALLMAAIEEMFAAARGMSDRCTKDLPPREALRAHVGSYVSRAHRDSRENGCPFPLLAGDLPRLGVAVRARFAAGVASMAAAMAGKLRQTGHPDPEAAASSAVTEMIGALCLARAVHPGVQSDAILAHTRAALLARLRLGGMA